MSPSLNVEGRKEGRPFLVFMHYGWGMGGVEWPTNLPACLVARDKHGEEEEEEEEGRTGSIRGLICQRPREGGREDAALALTLAPPAS